MRADTVAVAQERLAQLVIQALQCGDRTPPGTAQEAGAGGNPDPAAARSEALARVVEAKKLISGLVGHVGKPA